MTKADVDAIVRGMHPDPFAVLGPHEVATGLAIRVFRPNARAVELVESGGIEPKPFKRLHADGLFEIVVPSATREAFDYRVRVLWDDGSSSVIDDPYRYGPVLTSFDLHLLGEGTHFQAFEKLGARRITHGIRDGVHFAVWAPNAKRVSVVGNFNAWDGRVHPMRALRPGGYWEVFMPDLGVGDPYKFEIIGADGRAVLKSDPCGRYFERPPDTASIVWDSSGYQWRDQHWMASRRGHEQWRRRPMSIYEVHLGSWQRAPDGRLQTYREMAGRLVAYVKDMGFTHVEMLPVMEHPFTGSWGYQVIGFFAPTSRFGTPDDFKFLVDAFHTAGIGVILDWVPGHFPKDQHGLARFDGTALYEHADPRQGEHQDWGTLVFNYGRHEVRSFLLSNALFWLKEFHLDGLRVDAVASMLYLDYSRKAGEWVPNEFGGRENLEAIEFIKQLNMLIDRECPGTIVCAEESTSWPGVTRPVHLGGLGFTYKWNMGWMHDMLDYAKEDPVHRKWHHNRITFSMMYAYSEAFILPFSHDEVVHGKKFDARQDAGRCLAEARQPARALRLHVRASGQEAAVHGRRDRAVARMEPRLAARLGGARRPAPRRPAALGARSQSRVTRRNHHCGKRTTNRAGFSWIDCNDHEHSIIALVRRGRSPEEFTVAVVNFTPVPRRAYRLGVPRGGTYTELLNSDADVYGGGNVGNQGAVHSVDQPSHGHAYSLTLTVPPLGFVLLKPNK